MIGDLFAEEGDEDYGTLTSEQAKFSSLAGDIEKPPQPRQTSGFVGLFNQGATCYLNSLIQAMFMTPELRSAILSLPLCEETLNNYSPWLPEGQKREILMALQELFVKLQEVDENGLSTRNLTDSFHWTGEEVVQQHDVQELNRVLFDAIDRALQDTLYNDLIGKLYRGLYVNETICMSCGIIREREEAFDDISLNIKNCSNIYESLQYLQAKSRLDGKNQYFCETCGKKVDAEIGTKIKQLPPILTFSLSRFEYDMKTFERIKLTKNYEYQLELDLTEIVGEPAKYELFAVIIHGGTAYSGHYHAYIRDLLRTGNWIPVESSSEPKAEIVSEVVSNDNSNANDDNEDEIEPNRKKQKRNKRKKNVEKVAKEKEEVKKTEIFDYQDFPFSCSNPELLQNWYDFNDSVVTPIKSGKLVKQFGGSGETGYMLIYRNVNLNQNLGIKEIPSYWKAPIRSLNDGYAKHREEYEELKNWIEVQLQDISLFEYSDGLLKYILSEKSIDQGIPIRIKLTDTLGDLLKAIKNKFNANLEDYQLIEAKPLSNKYAHLIRKIEGIEDSTILNDAKFYHKLCLIVAPKNPGNELLKDALSCIGEDFEPISINCNILGEKNMISVNKGWTLEHLSLKIMEISGIPPNCQGLKIIKTQGDTKEFFPIDMDKTLSELKFYHSVQLSVNMKEEEFPEIEQKSQEIQNAGMVTVLVADETDLSNVIQHYVPLKWKVKNLVDELKTLYKIDTQIRLKKLNEGTYFYKEEINNKLKTVPEFEEGGYRICVERGEPPSMGQIVLRVSLEQNEAPKDVFCEPNEKIVDLKPRIGETLGIDMKNYKLYRTDWLKEPISVLKNENQTLTKAVIRDGDLLIVKPSDTVLATETVKIFVFLTKTGLPDSCEFLEEVSISEDSTLLQLKSALFQLPKIFNENLTPMHLRLRERTKTLWFGKVFREDKKTIKNQNISFGYNLVVQVLPEPESLSAHAMLLYVCERNVAEKSRINLKEGIFDFGPSPNVDHLYTWALSILDKQWGITEITLAKYKSHSFDWEIIKDERNANERGSLINLKNNKNGVGIYNLKKAPVLLKEGDLIAVKFNGDDPMGVDDFSCEVDSVLKEEYRKRQNGDGKKAPRKVKPEKAIKIADF